MHCNFRTVLRQRHLLVSQQTGVIDLSLGLWCVPHVLLLLADFGVGTERPCHFALVRTSKLGAIWRGFSPVSIKKLFSDTGNEAKTIAGQPNPRAILKSDVAGIDASWMTTGFARGLAACGRRQRDWRSMKP